MPAFLSCFYHRRTSCVLIRLLGRVSISVYSRLERTAEGEYLGHGNGAGVLLSVDNRIRHDHLWKLSEQIRKYYPLLPDDCGVGHMFRTACRPCDHPGGLCIRHGPDLRTAADVYHAAEGFRTDTFRKRDRCPVLRLLSVCRDHLP